MTIDEHILDDLDKNHAASIANRDDKGPTIYSRAADTIRQLLRKAELRRCLIEHASRDASWLSNMAYAVEHGEEADAFSDLIERQVEQSLTFDHGRKISKAVAQKLADATKHDLWRHIPDLQERADLVGGRYAPETSSA